MASDKQNPSLIINRCTAVGTTSDGMDDAVQTVMTQCELWTDSVMETD